MNAEDYFISLFASKSRAVGDDGALIGEWVYSKDAFFENVHFKSTWISLEQIGYRAMMVNISDAYAMNATPKYALLAVAMPKHFGTTDMRALHRGLDRAAKDHGIEIIGGDTISNDKLDITVTVVSKAVRTLRRQGLKSGHLIAHTGVLGKAQRELRYLQNGGCVHSRSKFNNLRLRQQFIAQSVSRLTCGMDISDGLFSDLEKLSRINRLGMQWMQSISRCIGCSGEEYEMLVGFDARQRKALLRMAAKHRVPLNIIAKARRGRFMNRCKAHHF